LPAVWNQSPEERSRPHARVYSGSAPWRAEVAADMENGKMKMSSILQSSATATGRFGPYGGRYVPETLMVPLFELERAYEAAKSDAAFQSRFHDLLKNFAGRPTPLQFASRLTEKLGGPRIYLQTRRFAAHRRAQNQQRDWQGPASRENGQAAHHCGNGRGPAWSRFR